MARVPISFYLNILAGIFVLFNHYAASETGDTALNKVAGAMDRFYTFIRDTTLTFQHGCTSRFQTALCGTAVDSVLPHDAAEYLRVRYCQAPAQNPESMGGASNDRQPHGYGGSDFAIVYYQSSTRPLLSPTSAEGLFRQSPFSFDWSSQSRLSQTMWNRSSEAMATIGVFLLRTYASWWWFRAPLKVTGVLLATYSALSALGYLLSTSVALRLVSQVYMAAMTDFLRCIEWEAQRRIPDIAVMMTEPAHGAVKYFRKRR